MKPLHALVLRATVLALLLLSLSASVASADDGLLAPDNGGANVPTVLPEDPGLELTAGSGTGGVPNMLPEDPGLE